LHDRGIVAWSRPDAKRILWSAAISAAFYLSFWETHRARRRYRKKKKAAEIAALQRSSHGRWCCGKRKQRKEKTKAAMLAALQNHLHGNKAMRG
jgi:hypothetical protein